MLGNHWSRHHVAGMAAECCCPPGHPIHFDRVLGPCRCTISQNQNFINESLKRDNYHSPHRRHVLHIVLEHVDALGVSGGCNDGVVANDLQEVNDLVVLRLEVNLQQTSRCMIPPCFVVGTHASASHVPFWPHSSATGQPAQIHRR